MALMLSRLQDHELAEYWPGFMAIFSEHGGRLRDLSDPKHLFVAILKGSWDLWVLSDEPHREVKVACLCSWIDHSYDRIYQVQWIGGDGFVNHIEACIDHVEKYALANGAGEMILFGREGWKRMLEPYGYVETQRLFAKPIRQLRGH